MDSYSDSKDFIYDELKKQYDFLENVKFGKLYDEFNDESKYDQKFNQKCQTIKDGLSIPEYYYEILNKFCSILHRIIVKINKIQNDLLEGITNNDKMHCIYLKYWLHDQLGNSDTKGMFVHKEFQTFQNNIKDQISSNLSNPCIFRELTWDQSNKIKSIYAFILLYYSHIKEIHKKPDVPCKYLNFFGKGLKAYYDSVSECSSEQKDEVYCQEFKEFQEIYKLDKLYWENSTTITEYSYSSESKDDCPLVIESLQSPLIISYRDKNNILYLSNEPIDFQKRTIISATSAVGTTVGISAFLFYLYKYTSLGTLFRTLMQKDNISFDNMDREAHDITYPSSKYEHTNFENILGVAPVLLTASALYRYTPVGSWIRKLGGYNTNNLSNMDRSEMDGFLSNTQVSGNIFFDNTENYISYQPL
ncbi:PIR Superfamily Protein [Plasmodium ovale wallikeri]|uniref:PIR Superfamily Protein n=1 Tax=Plasmodium ovale wallikeri TaxID=864142 RepID=A0A1A9AQE2_PLAOA|nr:PIR Superfamily Protein [Plasmodium ovale wallikeri]